MLKAILILTGVFIVLPVLLFFLLRRLARALMPPHRQPKNDAARQVVTPTGWALASCQVIVLLVGSAARELEPDGPLGHFLQGPGGLMAGFALFALGFTLAEHLLRKWGYPSTRSAQASNRDR